MAVRQLTPDDFADYRQIRLEALKTDPGAFGSNYEREAAFDDETWRSRMAGPGFGPATVFIDELDGSAVGTTGIAYTEHDPQPMLVGMWVRDAARGLGSGRRLVEAALAWARDHQADEVMLWVVADNLAAIKLYESCGFVAWGKVDAPPSNLPPNLPPNPCAEELEMRLDLR